MCSKCGGGLLEMEKEKGEDGDGVGESVFLFLEKTLETTVAFYAEDGDA